MRIKNFQKIYLMSFHTYYIILKIKPNILYIHYCLFILQKILYIHYCLFILQKILYCISTTAYLYYRR